MQAIGTSKAGKINKSGGIKFFFRQLFIQWELVLISLPFFIYIFIFSYIPLWGLAMAFQDSMPGAKVVQWSNPWYKYFQMLFRNPNFLRVIRNTLGMGIINIVLHFVTAILFALLLNELIGNKFKRMVQTVSYMPHFLSWIVVTGLVANMLAMDDGIINEVLFNLGLIKDKIHFLGEPKYFWWIVGWSQVWKEVGWNTIIYLAAITSIDPALYEAAAIDGCSRFKRNLFITLPGIKSTIIVLLIMNAGWILNVSFEVPYLLGNNGVVLDVSETIDIFVIKRGFAQENYALATAAGLFKTAVSVIILTGFNALAGLFGEEKLI